MVNEFRPSTAFAERSEKALHSVASFEMIGNRIQQQDAHGCRFFETQQGRCDVLAIADGHGNDGGRISKKAVEILLGVDQDAVDPRSWILQQFLRAQEQLKNEVSGTTASLVVRIGSRVTIGYLGDSEVRSVSRDGKLHRLTTPHQYGVHPGETRRLDAMHAEISSTKIDRDGVVRKGVLRVGDQLLEPSRVLGDKDFVQVVSSEPELIELSVNEGDRFFVLATDGFWTVIDHMSKRKKVESIFAGAIHAKDASEKLQGLLATWKLHDNTTVQVIED